MSLISPFLIEDVKEAYAAYCAMPHMQREGAKKPGLKKFRTMHAEKHPKAVEKANKVVEARNETPADLAQIVAEAVANALGTLDGAEPTKQASAKATTTKRRTPPADAARNAVLWRLNVEGLLGDAIDNAEGDYITQDEGTAILTEHFGPLEK